MDSTTFGLSPKKLATLLGIGAETRNEAVGVPQDSKQALLSRWLEGPVAEGMLSSRSASGPEDVPAETENDKTPVSVAGLLAGKADLQTVVAFKRHVKAQVAQARGKDRHAVATAVYYGAIACALVHYGQQTSSLTHEALLGALVRLGQKTWMDPRLERLYSQAQAICRQLADTQADNG